MQYSQQLMKRKIRPATLTVILGLFFFGPPETSIRAAESLDGEESAAIAAIKQIGGTVRRLSAKSSDWVVDFHLGGRKLTDEGLAHVAALKNVVSLNLRDTKVTSKGLARLKNLRKLRTLHLERTNIGDEGIEHLIRLPNLEYLNLYGTEITDASLAQLKELKNLRRLYIWQTEVSDEAVAKLEEELPGLTIVGGASLEVGANVRKRVLVDDATLPLAGEPWKLTGIRYEDGLPGPKAEGKIYYREKGAADYIFAELARDDAGRFVATIPGETTAKAFQYYIRIREPKRAPTTFPPAGGKEPAETSPDAAPPILAEDPKTESVKSYAVAIAWAAAKDDRGVASYLIYRGKDRARTVTKEKLLIKLNADQLKYTDDEPPAGQTVFYAVEPYDVAGRTGAARIVRVEIPKNIPPKNELKLAAAAGSKAVVIDWSGKVEPDVKQILVFRSDSPDGQPKQVAELQLADAQNWIDKNVQDDIDYRYFIKLRDAGGLTSDASGEVIAKAGGYLRRINCGGPELPSPDGAPWEADNGSVAGTGRFTAKSPIADVPKGLEGVYQTERWSYRGLRYRFEASPGIYRVTLHFAETNNVFAAKGKRTFDVLINDEKTHPAVDVFTRAGKATALALTTDFELAGEEISVELRKVAAGPAIKGLEIREISKAQD